MTLKEALEKCDCKIARKGYRDRIYIAFGKDRVDVYTIEGRFVRKAYPHEYKGSLGWKPLTELKKEIKGREC